MTAMVKWKDADSSNIERVGWFTIDSLPCAVIVFKDGRSYLYLNMTRQRAVAMLRAASVGRYFARNVRGQYDYVRIT